MIRFRPFTTLVLIVLLLQVTACTPSATGTGNNTTHDSPAMEHDMADMQAGVEAIASLTGAEFEIAFLDAMIPHHQSAVEMATIALERSQTPETLAAAREILDAQEAEIARMTTWLQEWHGRTPSGDTHGMAMPNQTEALRSVPAAEFDAAFYAAMIPHHESAVTMAELVEGRTQRSELTTLAAAIITAQEAEIIRFRAWLAENDG